MGSARVAFIGGCLGALQLLAFDVRAQPSAAASEPPSGFDAWLDAQRDAAGNACDRRGVDVAADRIVLACGARGLWIARHDSERGFVLVRIDDLGGPVVALFRRDGRIWAEVARREARDVHPTDDGASSASFPGDPVPVRSSEPAPRASTPVAPAPPPRSVLASRPEVPEGSVTAVLLGEVVIDLGEDDGLRDGDRVELSVVSVERVGDERAERRHVVAVGVVRAVSVNFSRVELGVNERVPVGAQARPVARLPTASRVAPPRLGGLWHAGFMLRPFVALDDLGGGFVADASIGHRFESDLHLEAKLSPLAWGTGADKPSVTPFAAFAKASYDPRLFEIGFGIGAETVYDTAFGTDSGTGALFVQQLRIGALDGLHLDTRSHVVLFHSRFQFSGFAGTGQVPVGDRWWLLFSGGGGSAGYGYGEIGVRALLRGNGDRGSFFFTGSVGGAGVFENQSKTCSDQVSTFPCPENVLYTGPMIGAGGEWRF